jgi:hypothetical protein
MSFKISDDFIFGTAHTVFKINQFLNVTKTIDTVSVYDTIMATIGWTIHNSTHLLTQQNSVNLTQTGLEGC